MCSKADDVYAKLATMVDEDTLAYLKEKCGQQTDTRLFQEVKNSICSAKEAKGEYLDLNDIKYPIRANIGEVPQETINWNILGGNQVRVGQWMSEAEYNSFVKTGIIPKNNVLRNGMEGYIEQAKNGEEIRLDKPCSSVLSY